jgi:hypothetical protein
VNIGLVSLCNNNNRDALLFQNGPEDVKRHRWFKGIEWQDVYSRKLKVMLEISVIFLYISILLTKGGHDVMWGL